MAAVEVTVQGWGWEGRVGGNGDYHLPTTTNQACPWGSQKQIAFSSGIDLEIHMILIIIHFEQIVRQNKPRTWSAFILVGLQRGIKSKDLSAVSKAPTHGNGRGTVSLICAL